jgi:hypothetical protein
MKHYILNKRETDEIVSIINALVEKYCQKYPDEYNFDEQSFGYTDSQIITASGDDLELSLDWVLKDVIPDLLK